MRYLPQKIKKKFSLETSEMERGVKGMIPACCLPCRGREGVTLIASVKLKKKYGQQHGFTRAFFFKRMVFNLSQEKFLQGISYNHIFNKMFFLNTIAKQNLDHGWGNNYLDKSG